jgi:1,4-dihydroxy-2-naphthoate octaprenyltransferase
MARLADWFHAIRPRTLVAAAVPVAVAASAYSLHAPRHPGVGSVLFHCLGFALLAQVASNLANDYGDGLRGADRPGRIGPPRAVAEGRISPRAMGWATVAALLLAFVIGYPLAVGEPWLLLAGILALLLAVGYTLGPLPLAYVGLGDLFVVACFGVQAVALTGYVLWDVSGLYPPYAPVPWPPLLADLLVAGLGVGLLADNILLANNARDLEADAAAGKRTTVVRFGRTFARALHGLNLLAGLGSLAWVFGWPPLLAAPLALRDHLGFRRAREGRDFVPFLARSALLLLLAGLLCITGACLGWGAAVR